MIGRKLISVSNQRWRNFNLRDKLISVSNQRWSNFNLRDKEADKIYIITLTL